MTDIHMLLGRLLERSEHTAKTVERIETRQLHIREELSMVKNRLEQLEGSGRPLTIERWSKRLIAVSAPAATFWATGSTEKAIEVLRLLFGAR